MSVDRSQGQSRTWPPSPAGRLAWSPAARRRVGTILTTILPPNEMGTDDATVAEFVGAFAACLPTGQRVGLRALCETLYLAGPALLLRRPARFVSLGIDDREEMLRRLAYSDAYPLRLAGTMLKSLAGLAVIGDPREREALGIDPSTGPLESIRQVRWNEDIAGIGRESTT